MSIGALKARDALAARTRIDTSDQTSAGGSLTSASSDVCLMSGDGLRTSSSFVIASIAPQLTRISAVNDVLAAKVPASSPRY